MSAGHNCCTLCTGVCKYVGAFCNAERFTFKGVKPVPEEIATRTTEVLKVDLQEALEEVVPQMKALPIDDTSNHVFFQTDK